MEKRELSVIRLWGSFLLILSFLVFSGCIEKIPDDPLPSWNEGATKRAVINFVKDVTNPDGPSYVPPKERIAAFDNDGTLWAEKPVYFQFAFMVQRVKELAPEHPEWRTTQPFKAVLENDAEFLGQISLEDIFHIVEATHTNITQTEFENAAKQFLNTARHPRFNRLYTECVYQPMLELIRYLQKNKFKVFICSGSGIDFIRQFSEEIYGIPRENVIGTSIVTEFRINDGQPELWRTTEFVDPLNDKTGKPVSLQRYAGRRPILVFGNSDGDIQMLQFARSSERPWLSLLLHHDDAEREFSYTQGTEMALNMAKENGWTVVYMKQDFKTVFPFESEKNQ